MTPKKQQMKAIFITEDGGDGRGVTTAVSEAGRCRALTSRAHSLILFMSTGNPMVLVHTRVGSTIIILCSILCLLQSHCSNTTGPEDGRPVQFRVHNGYSVKNTFVEEGSTTCLVFVDKATFDSILDWIADNNLYEPIPDGDFQTRIFPVVIKKGNSYWTMGVNSVTYAQIDRTLCVYFRATLVADNMSWIAVIPLVLSVQSGDYSTVRFYENGKFIGSVSTAR